MPTPCPFNWIGSKCKPQRLYHYARWHWIHKNIVGSSVTLTDPSGWSDPTERLWTNWIRVNVSRTVLCMCFTRTNRSEALWRVERPTVEGPAINQTIVRFRTSFDRLRSAVTSSVDLQDRLLGKSFLLPVRYLRHDHEIERRFDGLTTTKQVAREAARALSYKRYPYRYEREVRWVHVTQSAGGPDGRSPVQLDIRKLIDQIMIDPRTEPAVADQIKAQAYSAGFTGEVVHSRLFELPVRLRPFAARS